MKKSLIPFGVFITLVIIMKVTCPNESDHKEKICWGINQAINEKIGDSDVSIEGIFRWGGKMVLKKGAKFFIDQSISVKDYFVLSIGYYTFNDTMTLSLWVCSTTSSLMTKMTYLKN